VDLLLAVLLAVTPSGPTDGGYPDSIIATIPIGGDPTDIAIVPDGSRAYVGNELAPYVTVVDVAARSVLTRLNCGNITNMVAAHPDSPYVYISCGNDDRVAVIRATDNTVVASIPVGDSPHQLCVSDDGSRCYVACQNGNSVSVIRTSDNTTIASVPVGATPRDVCCLPAGDTAYTANIGEATLSVVRTSDNTMVGGVNIGFRAHRICALPDGQHVYASEYHGSRIAVLRVSDRSLVRTINAGTWVCGLCPVTGGEYLLVTGDDGTLQVVRTANDSIIDQIPVGGGPMSICRPADGTFVATSNRSDMSVTLVGSRTQVGPDVATDTILAPCGMVDSGSVCSPKAIVSNLGSDTAAFLVTMRIGLGYSSLCAETLAPAASDTVTFPDWLASVLGPHAVTCFTTLPGDTNPANDTAYATVVVGTGLAGADVAADTILAPRGAVDSGTVLIPRAVVSNLTDSLAVFPVALNIGADYSATVTETLPGLASDTLFFPVWTADSVAALPVVCFTALPGDSNPANDTCYATVTVTRQTSLDVSADSILAPQGIVLSGTVVTPQAIVRNRGLLAAAFRTTMLIGIGYGLSVQDTLNPGQSDTLSFPDWTALAPGTFPVTCYTSLLGDMNPANDTVYGQVIVNPIPGHDVGVQSIDVPDTLVASGDSLRPLVLVRNYGNQTERYFDVRFTIGAAYTRTVTCGVIEPGSAVTLEFPVWRATPGSFTASCSTMLASDTNPANDKAVKGFRVIRNLTLAVERDRVANVRAGETNDFLYYAEITGDTAATVDLAPFSAPSGWGAWYYDSSGHRQISTLGRVAPGQREHFQVRVRAPSVLSGDTAGLGSETFVVRGFCPDDPTLADTALLVLTLTPKDFEIHNFPNPLQTHTTFQFDLAYDSKVNLTVYNRAGERIRRVLENEDLPAGFHFASWAADNDAGQLVAPGTYQYVLNYVFQDRSGHITKKLLVTRE